MWDGGVLVLNQDGEGKPLQRVGEPSDSKDSGAALFQEHFIDIECGVAAVALKDDCFYIGCDDGSVRKGKNGKIIEMYSTVLHKLFITLLFFSFFFLSFLLLFSSPLPLFILILILIPIPIPILILMIMPNPQ